jgi:hypothetical protein
MGLDSLSSSNKVFLLILCEMIKKGEVTPVSPPISPILFMHLNSLSLAQINEFFLQVNELKLVRKRDKFRRFISRVVQQKSLVRFASLLIVPAVMVLMFQKPVLAQQLAQSNPEVLQQVENGSVKLSRLKKRLLIGLLSTTVIAGIAVAIYTISSTYNVPLSEKLLRSRGFGLYKIPEFLSFPVRSNNIGFDLTQTFNYMRILETDVNFGSIPNRAPTKKILGLLFLQIEKILKITNKVKLQDPVVGLIQESFQDLCKKDRFLMMYCKKLFVELYPLKYKQEKVELQLEMLKVLLARVPE